MQYSAGKEKQCELQMCKGMALNEYQLPASTNPAPTAEPRT